MDSHKLTAYTVSEAPVGLRPLGGKRAWMDATRDGHAYHCHPMAMANQWGWSLLVPRSILAYWTGGDRPEDLLVYDLERLTSPRSRAAIPRLVGRLASPLAARAAAPPKKQRLRVRARLDRARQAARLGRLLSRDFVRNHRGVAECRMDGEFASSHFGYGVVTFRPGRLFATSTGQNLWVKGPANEIVDGATPLEGIVETDWLPYTFTMNWKLTRPHHPVVFREGESFASILPYPREYIERFQTRSAPIASNPELEKGYEAWHGDRVAYKELAAAGEAPAGRFRPSGRYRDGVDTEGTRFHAHQRKLSLSSFGDEP
ncbi:MAG: DUF6065 family protein [Proteobacteria bacterium]|nr:DUF6065 family protein [Pseudomonadota bacterium]